MKLIFVRHGQTDYNKNKIVQGREVDTSLNDAGIKQAEETAKSLPNDIDFIISSPLKRAFQTAETLNQKLNKMIEFNENITELSYGNLAGKSWSEIEIITGDKNVHQKERDTLFDYRKFGGDSAHDMKQRVSKFVAEMNGKYPAKNILVATHGGVIDAMHVLFPQKERSETKNASVHEFLF